MNTLKFGNGEWYGKKDTILAYNDENSNFKPLPFSFDRASSATRVNKDGLIETVGSGEPRIDYKDDSKGALLLEPSRTNLITYSEQLNNGSGWINQLGSTVIGNQSGVGNSTSAWKLNKASGTFKSLRFQSTLSSNNYTLSWYLKKGSLDVVEFRFDGGASAQFIDFNLRTGVAGTNNALTNIKMELINNEWYRCQASYNSTLTNVHLYLGDASSTTQEGYIYAQSPQLEVGSYATSYIPTSGGAVTRNQDVCTNGGNEQVFNGSEGAMFLNFASYGDYVISLDNAAATNRIQFFRTTTNDRIYIMIGGTFIINEVYRGTSNGVYNKYALSYESGNILLYVNGSLLRTYTTPFTSTPFTKFRLNQYDNNSSVSLSLIDSKIYNTALTDQELINLTTI